MARYEDITATIGRTPVVRVGGLGPASVNLFVKLEARNPGGSVKDRLALGVIDAAERAGALKPGQTVIEATSGNTGIGLAVVCAQRGYPLVVVMAESFSIERRKLMRFLGAKVVLTPAAEKGSGMVAKAKELADAHGWFLTRQFDNEANADIHSRTTAVEILEDFADIGLDYWVTGFGTGGTLKGVSRVLKERSPKTRVVVCEPDNSPIFGSSIRIPFPADGVPKESHPLFRPHPVQGWSPDFVPKLADDARPWVDEIRPIDGREALDLARRIAREHGILTGTSGGATLAGALAVCRDAAPGSNVLAMLPDTGERYLSTPLFEDIAIDMTPEELEISRSTPRCRFDQPASAPASPAPTVIADDEARAFVENALADPAQPVVMFALAWCEFCWAVRKLFARCRIEHRTVELDSVALQAGDRGGLIRAALLERTGIRTIPQIFVAGKLLGGASEAFAAYEHGTLQTLLRDHGVAFDDAARDDLASFMPVWTRR